MKFQSIARSMSIALIALPLFGSLNRERKTVSSQEVKLSLTQNGKPTCSIVTIAGKEPELLTARAAEALVQTVQLWSGVALPVTTLSENARQLPDRAIVLAPLERLRKVFVEVERQDAALMHTASVDDQGFAFVPVIKQGIVRIYVVSRSPRGVYNGATYLRDFCIDGTREELYVSTSAARHSPQTPARAIYALTIWGNEQLYTAVDWERVFDSFARDGVDRVYFWVSGHFPSKKYPQTYRVTNDAWDTTKDSRIGTLEDQRRIIRYGHNLGIRVYLGGALGGWVGTRYLTNERPETLKVPPKEGPDIANRSLCPSHPASRMALVEYYEEMIDALPEADGLYIESADEWGRCDCVTCNKPVDTYGSQQFGQSQLSLLQEIARAVWQRHPHAHFAYTIGYAEHKNDPAYYLMIRQMSDPRFEWMEARNNWEFPGPEGKNLPASFFSSRIMRWSQYYGHSLEDMIHDANRAAKAGLYGSILAFEPGAGSGSFYKGIPFPTGILPYVLTGFAFREITWNPTLSVEDMHKRVQARFFGKEAPEQLGNDFWRIRDLIRVFAAGNSAAEHHRSLAEIEGRVNQARAAAGPKTLEALDLMTRAIYDIRKFSF